MAEQDIVETLKAFSAAWNAHDADALMALMTDDCVFYSSAGPSARGTEYRGRPAVKAASVAIWTKYPDAAWNNAIHFAAGDRAVSEWTFTGTDGEGNRVELYGCDLFVIRYGRIAVKDSFRKQRG